MNLSWSKRSVIPFRLLFGAKRKVSKYQKDSYIQIMDEEDIRKMEALSGEELIAQFYRERPRFLYYEGPLSFIEEDSFCGVRLDGVASSDNFPEDCVFLHDLLADKFFLQPGQWTEQGRNKFRIIVERVDWSDE